MAMLLVYIPVCIHHHMYSIRMSCSLKLVVSLGSMQAFSAQCVVESCGSHLHHSLQLVAPHLVVTLEGLVGGKEMKHMQHVCTI